MAVATGEQTRLAILGFCSIWLIAAGRAVAIVLGSELGGLTEMSVARIEMVRQGELRRATYFCPSCQAPRA